MDRAIDVGDAIDVADAPATADPEIAIPDDLRRMHGRPFGRDEDGALIAHGTGRLVVGAIRYLQLIVGHRAESDAPDGLDPEERAALVEAARARALDRLVEMLNAAIGDER